MQSTLFISIIGTVESKRRDLAEVLCRNLNERGHQVVVSESREVASKVEMVLLDNDMSDDTLKIEIAEDAARAKDDLSVMAIIGSRKFRVGRPEFQGHEVKELIDFLEQQFLKKHLLD